MRDSLFSPKLLLPLKQSGGLIDERLKYTFLLFDLPQDHKGGWGNRRMPAYSLTG